MKVIAKFLILINIIIMVSLFNVVYAARHSTSEEISYALNQSVNSLRKTDDYYSVMGKSDYNFFLSKKQICYSEFNYLGTIRGTVGGQEAATCMANAYLVLTLRKQFFDNIESYIEAFQAGNESDKNYYETRFKESYYQAEKWREQFRRSYGY